MREVVIVGAARTPIGAFGGAFKNTPVVKLGTAAAAAALERAGIKPEEIDEVILGNVLSAGQGMNPARQVAHGAGIPWEVPSMTLNKVCGSGLRAVTLGAQIIRAGDADIVLAGGMENMSKAPFLLTDQRWGYCIGEAGSGPMADSLIKDGLWDAFHDYHMGETAENLVDRYRLTREEQDAFAAESQRRVAAAVAAGAFDEEIVPMTVRAGRTFTDVTADEHPRPGTTVEKLAGLKPAFRPAGGTVTAGNSSGINDGAAAVVLMSAEEAGRRGITPLARLVSWASGGVDPAVMGLGPVPATRRALEKAGLTLDDLDLVEANEAFAAQSLAVIRELGLDPEKTNVRGGAIALGHPIGASGCRILVTLLYALKQEGKRRGLATLCIGGGQGEALIVERP